MMLSENSKITELEIHRFSDSLSMIGLMHVLRALGRRPSLTKLILRSVHLGRDETRQLRMVLCNTPSLRTLVLTTRTLGSAGLVELAPSLYHNTSIKMLDMSRNDLSEIESTEIFRDILRSNKSITALDLSGNGFGYSTGTLDCIAEGPGSNSTLLKIDLSNCYERAIFPL
jgi:hypothetical protein